MRRKSGPAITMVAIGWMLMIPPGRLPPRQGHRNKYTVLVPDAAAPLNGWYPLKKFSTELLCRHALSDLNSRSPGREAFLARHHDPRERKFMAKALPMAQCISNDDPRVKGVQ